jgi:predicted nucleic acid-binding Zn ribbon protein
MGDKRTGHVRQVLSQLITKWEKEKVSKGCAVREAWAHAVGENIKKHSRPVSLKNGTMVVIVEDTSWLYKLTLEKREILSRFNEKYSGRKKPQDLRFRIGSLDDR